MIHGVLIAFMGGWLMAQAQPAGAAHPLVTQTDLAPPGASQAKPPAPAPAPERKLETPKAEAPKKSAPPVEKNTPESKPEQVKESEKTLSVAPEKKAAGNRVAAFWIILPGK